MARRAEARATQRPRILTALVSLVATHGYPTVTIAGIARTAGVSLSAFYEHFADKETCLLAAYDAVASDLHTAVTAPQTLRGGALAYLTWMHEHPEAAITFVVAIHTAGPPALRRRAEVLDGFRRLVVTAKAPLRTDDLTALSVIATLDGYVHDRIVHGDTQDLAHQAGAVADLVVDLAQARNGVTAR